MGAGMPTFPVLSLPLLESVTNKHNTDWKEIMRVNVTAEFDSSLSAAFVREIVEEELRKLADANYVALDSLTVTVGSDTPEHVNVESVPVKRSFVDRLLGR